MLIGWLAVFTPIALALLVLWALSTHEGPIEHVHSLDCRDFYRRGLVDPDCLAPHPSNWFCPTETETP
jgi:hypothetical protein